MTVNYSSPLPPFFEDNDDNNDNDNDHDKNDPFLPLVRGAEIDIIGNYVFLRLRCCDELRFAGDLLHHRHEEKCTVQYIDKHDFQFRRKVNTWSFSRYRKGMLILKSY